MFTLIVPMLACANAATLPAETVSVPPGPSWSGSDLEAKARSVEYLLAAHGTEAIEALTRLKMEPPPRSVPVDGFHIMGHPVTQQDYAHFAIATGRPEPWIDPHRWAAQDTGLAYAVVERVAWVEGGPAPSRRMHPVVLVDRDDAAGYCSWWGTRHGGVGTLPTERQWSRAAGGDNGTSFPWGAAHDPTRANTWETGVGDTTPVGASPQDASAFGVHDLAGNVAEWTQTRTDASHSVLKGGSWAASLVEARTTARAVAPDGLRHVTVGFRCVFSAD